MASTTLRSSWRCLERIHHGRSARPVHFSHAWSTSLLVHPRYYATTQRAPSPTAQKTSTSEVNTAPSTARKIGKARHASAAEEKLEDSVKKAEEQLRVLETMQMYADTNLLDVSALPLELFDLHIPSWKSQREGATLLDHLRAIYHTQSNWFLNVRSLYRLAKTRSLHGMSVKSPWSWQLFATQSTKPDAWIAPFRHMALDIYKQVNEAVAARDHKAIKALSCDNQQAAYTKMIRSQDPRYVNIWKFHGERTPCRVVSLRAVEGYYGIKAPRIGSRLAVQALVRFDTLQSLETYSKKTGSLISQSEPKGVVEYLVLQKRMWYDSPWVIRERLYEGLETRFKQTM